MSIEHAMIIILLYMVLALMVHVAIILDALRDLRETITWADTNKCDCPLRKEAKD